MLRPALLARSSTRKLPPNDVAMPVTGISGEPNLKVSRTLLSPHGSPTFSSVAFLMRFTTSPAVILPCCPRIILLAARLAPAITTKSLLDKLRIFSSVLQLTIYRVTEKLLEYGIQQGSPVGIHCTGTSLMNDLSQVAISPHPGSCETSSPSMIMPLFFPLSA